MSACIEDSSIDDHVGHSLVLKEEGGRTSGRGFGGGEVRGEVSGEGLTGSKGLGIFGGFFR